MKKVLCITSICAALLYTESTFAAWSMGSKKLDGKRESECVVAIEQVLKDAGFSNPIRGKLGDGSPGPSFFGFDKPYEVGIKCDGDFAYWAVVGPDHRKTGEIWRKIMESLR